MQISGRTPLAIGGSNDNIFAGTYIEFMPDDGILQFGFTSDCGAAAFDEFKLDVLCGTELIASAFNPRSTGAAGTAITPVYPDDFTLSCGAPAGVRIIGKIKSSSAAARNLFWVVMFDPA